MLVTPSRAAQMELRLRESIRLNLKGQPPAGDFYLTGQTAREFPDDLGREIRNRFSLWLRSGASDASFSEEAA